jgi:hypothetical protein
MRQLRAALALALMLAVALPHTALADSVARTWDLGREPAGMAIDPTDGRVFIANTRYVSGPGTISVVDPSREVGGVTSLVTSGPPGVLAVDPVHRRLYSSNQDRTLQVFDLATMSLEATLPVGGLGVGVDPLTRRVYVVDFVPGSGTRLVVVDGSTNAILPQTVQSPPGEFWWGLALDPGVNRIYVTNMNNASPTASPSLVALDDDDLTVVDDIPLAVIPRFAIAVDEAQHRVFVAGADPNPIVTGGVPNPWPNSMFYAFDGSTSHLALLGSTMVPGYPTGMAHFPARHRIFLMDTCECHWGYREIDDQSFEVVRFNATPWGASMAASHPDGRLYVDSWGMATNGQLTAISLGNTPPSISRVTFNPSAPTTADAVRAYDDAVDVDFPSTRTGTDLTRSYVWSRNGVVIPGQTDLDLDLRTVAGDRGDTLSVRITVTDRDGASASVTDSVVIANAAPTVTVSLDSAAPRTNDVLRATANTSDADDDPVGLAYQWTRNGVVIPSATTGTLDLSAVGDRGDVIEVRATANDGHGGVSQAAASVTVANTAPSTPTLVLNTASPRTNDVLQATASGSVDADGDVAYYEFAYYVNEHLVWYGGPRVDGNISFDLAAPNWGDRGDAIRVVVWSTDGPAQSAPTSASAVVVMTVDLSLSDATPSTRDVVTATALVTDSGPPVTFTYVWRVNGVVKRTTSGTTANTDSLDLAARGVSRQGDVVVCAASASDGVSTGSATAQAIVSNNKH